MVDAEHDEVFGLDVIHVRDRGDGERTAFGVIYIERVELTRALTRAGPVALLDVAARRHHELIKLRTACIDNIKGNRKGTSYFRKSQQ
jgi:hypothetical protein